MNKPRGKRRRLVDRIKAGATACFATERRRFFWIILAWLIALFVFNSWIATLIAGLALLVYWNYFIEFLRAAFRNEWPYNFLAALGAVLLYVFHALSTVFADRTISTITGFHPSQFPSASILLSTLFMFFASAFAFAVVSGLAALATGFSSGSAGRVFPIAFMVSVPVLSHLLPLMAGGHDQETIYLAEDIIAVDFAKNGGFEFGTYLPQVGAEREYGTKVCRKLPFEVMLAPHEGGGYITATFRGAVKFQQPSLVGKKDDVLATKYVYGFVKQEDCPTINGYVEGPFHVDGGER